MKNIKKIIISLAVGIVVYAIGAGILLFMIGSGKGIEKTSLLMSGISNGCLFLGAVVASCSYFVVSAINELKKVVKDGMKCER